MPTLAHTPCCCFCQCASQNVAIRKVKVLKAPKFDLTKLMDVHGDYTEEVSGKVIEGGRVLTVKLLQHGHVMVTRRKHGKLGSSRWRGSCRRSSLKPADTAARKVTARAWMV